LSATCGGVFVGSTKMGKENNIQGVQSVQAGTEAGRGVFQRLIFEAIENDPNFDSEKNLPSYCQKLL